MSTENTSGSPLNRIERILEELKHALKEALEGPHQCATKHDLHEMEVRLTHEIKTANQGVDLTGLPALLERTHATLAKLQAVDVPQAK